MSELLINIDWYEIWQATLDTMLMFGGSLLFTVLLGLPVGVLLFLVGPRQMFEHRVFYAVLSFIVNVLRSLPFIILLIVMIPITVLMTGIFGSGWRDSTARGGTTPFLHVWWKPLCAKWTVGIIEATWLMGASTRQIIFNALLPEARLGLLPQSQ